MKQITAKIGQKQYTWKLFACKYVYQLIKRDKRFRDIEVTYKKVKPYYWRRADV